MPPEIFGRIVGRFSNSGAQRPLTCYLKPRNGSNSRDTNRPDAETALVGWRRSRCRASLRHEFPGIREFYREFRIFPRLGIHEFSRTARGSETFEANSLCD